MPDTTSTNRAGLLTGPQRVWLLAIVMAAIAAGVAGQFADLGLLDDGRVYHVPWWSLAIMAYFAEITVVHLRFHRHAHSFSMSEVPLVIGLFCSAPWEVLAALLIGNAAALLINRRQPPLKLAFNLSMFALEAALAIAVFRAVISLGAPLGAAGWVGAILAMQLGVLLANVLINAAIHLSGGRLDRREQLEVVGMTALAAAMNTALALVGVTILWSASETAWLALVPPVVLFLAYRAYISQRLERSRLESLYEATRVLHKTPQIEFALSAAARYAQNMFEAEFVEIILLPDETNGAAYLTAIGPGARHEAMVPIDLAQEEDAWAAIANHGTAKLIERPAQQFPRVEYVVEDAIAAPLTSDEGVLGVILVANRLADVSNFDDSDVRLLETFASQVSVSLENGRLEDSLAQLTELKEELRHQALHDSLTKLANRTLFADGVETAIRQNVREDRFVAVMFLDLDDFKTVNDSLGHAAGDELLVQVAGRLRTFTRPDDLVARLGGDEFAILLENLVSPSDATDVAERILRGMRTPFTVETKDLNVRTSIGIAFGGQDEPPEQLLRNADAAMYAAKQKRKGTYRVFEDEMHAEMIRRLELKADLADALRRNELGLLYQPVVDLTTGEVTGVEALVRWSHPTKGLVPPGQFIGFAEETGLIVRIGEFVLNEACRQARVWRDAYPDRPITMAINLSPRQLAEVDVPAQVSAALAKYGLPSSALIVEITENVVMQTAIRTLDELRELGVKLAIDDFGTGYSSLSYLDRLPIDVVKIDKSFVDRLSPDGESPLVRTVLQIGDALGIDTIVEGIETAHQLRRLRQLGCTSGQGFYLSPPIGPDDIERLLDTQQRLVPEVMTPGSAHLRVVG
ncbi:MAG: EAL domain-containing protein [Acidimicrobiia bacterium]|nr:EAL domain-containing protein [Acidimicrobiia bacterium]